MKTIKRILALILALTLVCSTTVTTAFAVVAGNWTHDSFELTDVIATLDGVNSAEATVSFINNTEISYFAAINGTFSTSAYSDSGCTQIVEGISLSAMTPASSFSLTIMDGNTVESGIFSYQDNNYSTLAKETSLWSATYTVAANTTPGIYYVKLDPVGVSDMMDNRIVAESYTATIEVKESTTEPDPEPEEPVEPQGSDYEIYYELSGSTFTGTGDTDEYTDYNIGDPVNATIYIKNTGDSAVNLQAYDIYLTYDSKLTCGTFTPKKDAVGSKISDANGQARIQAVGKNVGDNADINIALPADGTGVELGTIAFTMNSDVEYNEGLEITLLPGSAEQGDSSTNIGVGYDENGDKNSYYPSVTANVLGAEVMTTYKVEWKNDDGSEILETDAEAPYKHAPSYDGATPTKTDTNGQYTYTFEGWAITSNQTTGAKEENLPVVTKDVVYYAAFSAEKNTRTITFNANDGTDAPETKTQPVNVGESTKLEANTFSRTGYTFAGWNTEPDGSGTGYTVDDSVTTTTDLTLYAQWTINKYTVIWNNWDNNPLETDENVPYGTTPEYNSGTPTKESTIDKTYTFASWTPAVGAITGDTTYTATFTEAARTYTVKFATEANGTLVNAEDQTIAYDSTLTKIPTATPKEGYKFDGWYVGVDKIEDISSYTVSGDVTLTAKYSAEQYTITLNVNGGDALASNTILYDITDTVTLPTATKTGATFDGWKLATKTGNWEATTYNAGNYDNKYGTFELVAQWSNNAYTVSKGSVIGGEVTTDKTSANFEDSINVTVTLKDGYTLGDNPTATYTYKGENNSDVTKNVPLTKQDDGSYIGSFEMPAADVNVSANITAIDYNVDLPDDESVTANKTTANVGDEITLTVPSDKVPDGYKFKEFVVTRDDNDAPVNVDDNGKFEMPASNVTVTVKFEPISYTIAFDGNGATSGNMNPITGVMYDADQKLTKNVYTKNGYKFTGWLYNGTTYADEATVKNLTDIDGYTVTLVAQWTVDTYNITLNTNDGKYVEGYTAPTTYTFGTTTTLPTKDDIIKTGHDFGGWYTDSNFSGNAVTNIGADAYGDKEYWVKWTPSEYTIDYDSNGGSEVSDGSYTYGEGLTTLPTPTKPGYDFGGWYENINDETTKVESISSTDTGDMALIAKWTPTPYTITLNPDGGTVSAVDWVKDESTGYYNKGYTIADTVTLPTPTKTNYIFTGWKVTTAGGDWAVNSEISVSNLTVTGKYGNVTLTAQWDGRSDAVVEEYKYAANGYVMLFVADDLGENEVYQFGTGDNAVTMYYTTASEYVSSVGGATGLFYTLIDAKYAETKFVDNNEVYTGKLNADGLALLNKVSGDKTSVDYEIKYEGYINGDDVVNIADANVVYQMIINGGGYYGDLDTQYRLGADMHKENIDSSTKRATIEDVNAIVNIINGTT